jgi:hypothetical protein
MEATRIQVSRGVPAPVPFTPRALNPLSTCHSALRPIGAHDCCQVPRGPPSAPLVTTSQSHHPIGVGENQSALPTQPVANPLAIPSPEGATDSHHQHQLAPPKSSPIHSPVPTCPACNYSLINLPAGPCPECGRPFDPADPPLPLPSRRLTRPTPRHQHRPHHS